MLQRVKSALLRNNVTRKRGRKGRVIWSPRVSANIQLSVALFPPSPCTPLAHSRFRTRIYSRALYIKYIPRAHCSHTVVSFSPMNFNENPRGTGGSGVGRSGVLRVASNAAVVLTARVRPSARRLRPLLIRHSFLTTANKFWSSFPPSHLIPRPGFSRFSRRHWTYGWTHNYGPGAREPANDRKGDRDYPTSARMHWDLGVPPQLGGIHEGY